MEKTTEEKISPETPEQTQAREDRCAAVTQAVFDTILQSGLKMGKITEESKEKQFVPLASKVLDVLLEKAKVTGFTLTDLNTVTEYLTNAIELTWNLVAGSVRISKIKAEQLLWGKHRMDITLDDIDGILKKSYTPDEAAQAPAVPEVAATENTQG